MKTLCRLTAFSLTILFIVSCGTVKKPVPPRYRFDLGKTLQYQVKGNADVLIDAGIAKTSSKMDYSAMLEITAVETNSEGYKLRIDIKDPQISTPVPQISTAFYMAMNSIRNSTAVIQLSERGQAAFLSTDNNAYASLLFPDFSDYQEIIHGIETNFRIPAEFQREPLLLEFKKSTKLQYSNPSSALITNSVLIKAFDRQELEKSVEATPLGSFKLEMFDVFQINPGRLREKKGAFQFSFDMPMKSGFLTLTMSVSGTGNFEVTLGPGENLK